MKKFLEMILKRASEFINYKKNTQEIEEDNANILQMIETALQKKSGVHVIFLDKSFTGDIVKYDKDKGRWYGDGLSRTYRIDITKEFLPYYKVIGNIYENQELLEVE